jgi:ribonuclease-3 family protein
LAGNSDNNYNNEKNHIDESGAFINSVNRFNNFEISDCEAADPYSLSPLVLAYVGDSVFELYIRTMLATNEKGNVNKLHRAATGYVKSGAQAKIARDVSEILNDKEKDILRRGRNVQSGYVPKNAVVTEYRYATGFEALLGYLYLSGSIERLIEILKFSVGVIAD